MSGICVPRCSAADAATSPTPAPHRPTPATKGSDTIREQGENVDWTRRLFYLCRFDCDCRDHPMPHSDAVSDIRFLLATKSGPTPNTYDTLFCGTSAQAQSLTCIRSDTAESMGKHLTLPHDSLVCRFPLKLLNKTHATVDTANRPQYRKQQLL